MVVWNYSLLDKIPCLFCSAPGNVENAIGNTRQWRLQCCPALGCAATRTKGQLLGFLHSWRVSATCEATVLSLLGLFSCVMDTPKLSSRCSYRWDLLKCYWCHTIFSSLHNGNILVSICWVYIQWFLTTQTQVYSFRWHKSNNRSVWPLVMLYERLKERFVIYQSSV